MLLSDSCSCWLWVVWVSFSHFYNFLRVQFCILCRPLMGRIAALLIDIIWHRLFMRICTSRTLLLLDRIHSLLAFCSTTTFWTKWKDISPSVLNCMHLGIRTLHRLFSIYIYQLLDFLRIWVLSSTCIIFMISIF